MRSPLAGLPALFMIAVLAACQPSDDPLTDDVDYLAPDLREKVEALKENVTNEPTDAENVNERLEVFQAWSNAMAIRDGGLKFAPNLTVVARSIRAEQSGVNYLLEEFSKHMDVSEAELRAAVEQRMQRFYAGLDQYVRELTLREEEPEIFGELVSVNTGPFEAQSYQTIRQTWTTGSRPVGPGGYFLLARHFMADQGIYQTSDPAADNYVTIGSDNPAVTFEPVEAPMFGMHGGFRGATQMLAFAVREGTLQEGDKVTITYGDTSGGSRGFQVQSITNDYYQLPVYLSFDGDHDAHYMLDLTAFSVKGKEVKGVKGFAPSVVEPGEPFRIVVRSEDEFRNKATGHMPVYNVWLHDQVGKRVDDEPAAMIEIGGEAIHRIKVQIDQPGFHYFVIESDDGTIRGESNPIRVQENPTQQLYWGETHGHSGFAEGQGTPEGYFRFARDESRLDFITLSEHDIWLDDGEWERMRDAVERFNDEGEFITYMGYEWTVDKFRGGHHNVLFRNTATAERVASQDYAILEELYEGLKERYDAKDVLVIPHAHQTAYWPISDHDLENLVEIQSLHGHFEWFGQAYLEAGHHVGFIAASDDHLGHPGYNSPRPTGFVHGAGLAAVWASNKTTDAIFDAMKSRQAYAASLDRMILDVQVNDAAMGSLVAPAQEVIIEGEVMGTDEIDNVTIVRNDEPVHVEQYRIVTAPDGESQWLDIRFFSPSHPVDMVPDNPRGYRLWHGYLDVSGAEVLEVIPGWDNPHFPETGLDAGTPNRVHFATRTRGEPQRLKLHLKGASARTRIDFHLEENREQPTAPATLRPPQMVPAASFGFELAGMDQGVTTRRLEVDEYVDEVRISLVEATSPRYRRFEYVDAGGGKPGDSWYVRVEQANGSRVWSSPVFVVEPEPVD
ncbi:MAG: DUF3604 domain-containing protein [Pseudomonadales bacterium]|nr:DUF3604 domain-containing protein [Pseudomonadales bacterium]